MSAIWTIYSHSSHCLNCGNYSIPLAELATWQEMLHLVLYYAYPSVVIFGFIFGLVNIITLTRQIQSAHDGYLLGLAISSTLLEGCGAFMWLPMYIGHYDIYQQMHGYFVSINDWFWYTSLWLILVMNLERCLTLTQNRAKSVCSPVQASVCTVMLYCVCLMSALPRFWEFKVEETPSGKGNITILMSVKSPISNTPEYRVMYFWYLTSITVFLPIPVLLVLVYLLGHVTKAAQVTKRRLSNTNSTSSQNYAYHQQSTSTTSQLMTRKVENEINLSRLYSSFIVCYILLTSPKVVLDLLERITVGIVNVESNLFHTLHDLFQTLFYLNYACHFLLYISYYKKYRTTLKAIITCQCKSNCCERKQ